MKFRSKKLPRLFYIFTLAIFMTVLGILIAPVATLAQYTNDAYGQCAYGQACPSPQPPTTPPDDNPEDPTPDTPIVQPNETPTDPTPPSSTSQPSPTPLDKSPLSEFGNRILQAVEGIIDVVPPGHQSRLPYYSWLPLLLLAIVLLITSAIEHEKAVAASREVDTLRVSLDEQRNFLRLVIHHLNTPLATIKNTLELLSRSTPPETQAIQQLNPATLELSATIDHSIRELTESSSAQQHGTTVLSHNISYKNTLSKWYFLVPVAIVCLVGILLNVALNRLGVDQPQFTILYQFGMAIIVGAILANSIRLSRVTNRQHEIVEANRQSIKQIDAQRRQITTSLASSLSGITQEITPGATMVKNQKLSGLLASALTTLQTLAWKIDASTQPLSNQPKTTTIPVIVTAVLGRYTAQIEAKGIVITSDYDSKTPVTTYLPDLQFILASILENAITYTPEGGSIHITGAVKKGALSLSVRDSGSGMSQQEQALLFKPFSKAEDALTYNHGGAGISLYVSQRIATRLGGEIVIHSHEQRGTTAEITLPLA